MEDVKQSTVNSSQSTVNPTPSTVHRSPNSFLVILLSILLIISCLIAGFFAYQTQKLVKELTIYRLQPTQTPIPSQTPDPTTDWKTYTSTKYEFSLSYPAELVTNIKEVDIKKDELDYNRKCNDGTYDGCGGSKWPDYKITFYRSSNIAAFDVNIWNGDMTEYFGGKFNKNKTYLVGVFRMFDEDGKIEPVDENLLKQISTTLNFVGLEASSSPLSVACTMEAKVCPDGSSVGRSGPKCEFAPCPATSPRP